MTLGYRCPSTIRVRCRVTVNLLSCLSHLSGIHTSEMCGIDYNPILKEILKSLATILLIISYFLQIMVPFFADLFTMN